MTYTTVPGREHDLGHGLIVWRALPSPDHAAIGPFVFWDHAGPVRLNPALKALQDVRPHPHIGLSTLSYPLSGALVHRDNLGCTQVIRPGEVNWMTAGRGIVHSERLDDPSAFAGEGLELLQSWVALPEDHEDMAPTFEHYAADDLPTTQADGVWLRLIAGAILGLRSPVRTYSPLFYLHARIDAGATFRLPAEYSERAAYVVHGRIRIAGDPREFNRHDMVLLDAHGDAAVTALEPATVALLGGEPLGPRYVWWNLVASSRERIERAAADWKAGRFRLPASDNREFIPLPDTPFPWERQAPAARAG